MTDMPPNPAPFAANRRNFLSAAGATLASLQTAACIRKPYEKILPYAKRPEDLVPGNPRYYATAFHVGSAVQGLLVKSSDGRPTKVEGNPRHPMSRGATSVWAQASVLELYDPQRSQQPYAGREATDVDTALKTIETMGKALRDKQGAGFAVVVDEKPSPTLHRLLGELAAACPQVGLYVHDGAGSANARAGAAMVGVESRWSVSGSPRILAVFDGDPMGTEGDTLAFSRTFAQGREPEKKADANRLYVAESTVSLTGSNADHRLAVRPSEVGDLVAALSEELRSAGLALPAIEAPKATRELAFVKVLAEDLLSARGSSVVWVGERQPPQVHALGQLINHALGNYGRTMTFAKTEGPALQSMADLGARIDAGEVDHLVVLGTNLAYTGNFGAQIRKVEQSLHLGLFRDDTGRRTKVHIPQSHYLETWGDLVANDGTVSIQQPLIAPLYTTVSEIELLSRLMGKARTGFELVQDTHRGHAEDFDRAWQVWLHDGKVAGHPVDTTVPTPSAEALAASWSAGSAGDGYEIAFVRDLSVLDGRFGNSPWLQELPDPITKLTWDNAVLLSPSTADKLGVKNEDMVSVSMGERTIDLPAWVQEGAADDVLGLVLGYGQGSLGRFAESGFAVESMRDGAAGYLTGAKATRAGGTYTLACAQVETSQYGRHHTREATRTDFTDEPNFVAKFDVLDESHIGTLLWEEPEFSRAHQWAMTVDLNSCTGCGTCTIACQAENNIPWVGKQEVLMGREMHWIRVDRYFEGQSSDFAVKYQPLNCAQCETAPCENVCPVGATVHDREGLNNMAYNRCIGTRYCANNCPYKVRRFNFFHYTVRNDEDYGMGIAMQRNPDVTVRYRGVMEKCTFCTQRINRARIDAKVFGDGTIEDGAVTPACAQACPTEAITFGNMADENSRVAKKREDDRNYALLAELNIRPRTTYLGRLTNPNPKLANG
jgi:molybdopterin-containing oxidoreductase family iron-sulfur binding subunit